MPKFYITFGQIHAHRVNGKTFDCDCVAEIEAETNQEAHDIAMDVFDRKFHQCFDEDKLEENLPYFPRGIIPLKGATHG